jgi:flavorubredoxin
MTYIHKFEKKRLPYSKANLVAIDAGFKSLIEMDEVSARCHNALYFIYLGFHTTHWIESFVFLMNSLEALFSKDASGGSTKTICTRVSSFLDFKTHCEYDDIEHLYDIRSRIVHGNIVAKKVPDKNLKELHHLQFVIIECMKKILQEKVYLKFVDKKTRDSYLGALNKSR